MNFENKAINVASTAAKIIANNEVSKTNLNSRNRRDHINGIRFTAEDLAVAKRALGRGYAEKQAIECVIDNRTGECHWFNQ